MSGLSATTTTVEAVTIASPEERAAARARLIEIIARQIVQQIFPERHESLPVRTLQH
jgi:hypothetical protein